VFPKVDSMEGIENKILFPIYKNEYGEGLGSTHTESIKFLRDNKLII